jgi:hypothetical protein
MTDTSTTGAGAGRSSFARSAKEEISKAGETLKEDAARLAADAKDELRHRAEAMKDEVTGKVEETKGSAAHSLEAFAEAVRKAGDELKSKDENTAARLVGEAARGLEGFSRMLNEKSIDGIVDSVRSFARSNPAAFVAGSVLAGVALGRFVRSSGRHHHSSARDDGYRSYENRPGVSDGETVYGSNLDQTDDYADRDAGTELDSWPDAEDGRDRSSTRPEGGLT